MKVQQSETLPSDHKEVHINRIVSKWIFVCLGFSLINPTLTLRKNAEMRGASVKKNAGERGKVCPVDTRTNKKQQAHHNKAFIFFKECQLIVTRQQQRPRKNPKEGRNS